MGCNRFCGNIIENHSLSLHLSPRVSSLLICSIESLPAFLACLCRLTQSPRPWSEGHCCGTLQCPKSFLNSTNSCYLLSHDNPRRSQTNPSSSSCCRRMAGMASALAAGSPPIAQAEIHVPFAFAERRNVPHALCLSNS